MIHLRKESACLVLYPPEFRERAVELARERAKPLKHIARDLGDLRVVPAQLGGPTGTKVVAPGLRIVSWQEHANLGVTIVARGPLDDATLLAVAESIRFGD